MEAQIQELEKEFDQIDFDKMMLNNQDEKTPVKEKYMEITTNISKADPEFNISEVDDSKELCALDIRQNQKKVDVQFHASDLDRNSPFIDDLQMDSNKKIESLEMQTQVEIHKENSKHEIDTNISQPLDLVSTQSDRDKKMVTKVDVIKLSKLQNHTLLNEQVLNLLIILDGK